MFLQPILAARKTVINSSRANLSLNLLSFFLQNDTLVFSSTSTFHLCISSVYFTFRRLWEEICWICLNFTALATFLGVHPRANGSGNWPIRARDLLLLCYNIYFKRNYWVSVLFLRKLQNHLKLTIRHQWISSLRATSNISLPPSLVRRLVDIILLYKHQWNTRWAFARKLDIFRRENNMLSSHVKISPLLWLHNKSRLSHQKTIKVKYFGSSLVFI